MTAPDHSRVREVFLAAIDLPAEEQKNYVARECGDDDELRRAVQRLIDHHDPETLILDCEQVPPDTVATSATPGTLKFGETVSFGAPHPKPILRRKTSAFRSAVSRSRLYALASLIAVSCLLILTGLWVNSALHNAASESLQRTMQALLDEQIYAIETWLSAEERIVRSWTRSPEVVKCVDTLNQLAKLNESPQKELSSAPEGKALRSLIARLTSSDGSFSYALWNREGTLLADSDVANAGILGNSTTEYGAGVLSRVFQGDTVLWLPSRAGFITRGFTLSGKKTKPGIALIAPVFNANERPIAAMLISDANMQPSFEQMLAKARFGDTGEAYAFAEDGYLITESRFVGQLQEIGLVESGPDAWSTQVVKVADPGGNMLDGFRPDVSPAELPLTRAAYSAVAQVAGADFSGYRDYRGVRVVGVWAWLPRYRFGIATEVDHDKAFHVLTPLHRAFLIVLAALGLAMIAIIGSVFALLRSHRAAGDQTKVGPYTLKSLIGEGGFARVYLADHALLKRQTAVKILKPEQLTKSNMLRFEREVQLASGLTHPNTIGIYDYGSTEDGDFYYSMEYIKGLALNDLVEFDGPQSPERVVWILKQICRSLREAHNKGLLHRDIKPQNIMLCRRGGEYDTVKVLDFGLAREFEPIGQKRVTETKLLIGTPMYIAPERIMEADCMDARSDIYSLGILGYYLLTGREPFDAVNSIDALSQTMNRSAKKPSKRTRNSIPEKLDQLIHDCHVRELAKRPQTIEDVLDQLDAIKFAHPWNQMLAKAWWDARRDSMQDNQKTFGTSEVRKTIELALRNKTDNTQAELPG